MMNLLNNHTIATNLDQGNGSLSFSLNFSIESLTRDVYVKPLHSHNDYWRKHPLFDALSIGAQSIESDIWYFPNNYTVTKTIAETETETETTVKDSFNNQQIYVGHNQVFLNSNNTLNNLYLDPLFEFLQSSNPQFKFDDSSIPESPLLEDHGIKHGVFYNSPESSLYLWFDFKTDANSTYDALKPLIQKFIDREFVAYYDVDKQQYVPGPLVLTITGNLPQEKVEAESKRYLFLDAPLKVFVNETNEAELSKWQELSRVASGSLTDLLGDTYESSTTRNFDLNQKQTLQSIFDKAHKYKLKTRVWGDITWPNSILNSHLRDYFELGSDFINVDNLKLASEVL